MDSADRIRSEIRRKRKRSDTIAIQSLLFYSHLNGMFLTLPIISDTASNYIPTVNQPFLEAA